MSDQLALITENQANLILDMVLNRYKKRMYTYTSNNYTPQQKKSLEKYKEKLQEFASNPRVAPLAADDEMLLKMPDTHIMTSEYDVLRDDGVRNAA